MSEPDTPLSTVEGLIDALRAHATFMTPVTDPVAVMPCINEVRAAALRYVESVAQTANWGNVFADLYDDWDDGGDDDLDDTGIAVADGVERLSLTGRWDFLVRDPGALQALASARLTAAHPDAGSDSSDEHVDTPGSALESLIAEDIGRYPGLEGAGGGWTIAPIEKTLFEMTSQERDATGF